MSTVVNIINQSEHLLPTYESKGAAGMDIRANLKESVTLHSLERKLIPTGLFIELPNGYEAQVRPRSGLAIKRGLTVVNTPGTIDSDYRGELQIPMINLSAESQIIENGDRIAQLVIAKYETVEWQLVTEVTNTERGAGGFGSSGVK